MRVISGTAGGLRLKTPKRLVLRPTQDRIRQVIFSSLAERISGAYVLDLYAGTGSIGIEALSRGAARAVFVEKEAEATQCIRDNLLHCKLIGDLRREDVDTFFQRAPGEKFDLVFADPPYVKHAGALERDLPLENIAACLKADGLLIWEHFAGRRFEQLSGWDVIRQKSYGETGLTFLRYLGKNKKIALPNN